MRVLLTLALFSALALGTPSVAAGADSYETAGCPPEAPLWRIAYHLYWSDTQGRTLDRSAREGALRNAEQFTAEVGRLSECAVRARVDIVDEAGPYVHDEGYRDARYDAVFHRFPATGDSEEAPGSTDYHNAWFPVSEGTSSEPNPMLLMHEWLHMVVRFYETPLGWPEEDVHGACRRPDYESDPRAEGWPCLVNPAWFADLMTGRVLEEGVARGLPKEAWARLGIPTRPLNRDPGLGLERVPGRGLRLEVTSSAVGAPIEVRIDDSSRRTVWRRTISVGIAQARELRVGSLRPGTYEACATSPASGSYRAARSCLEVTVRPRTGSLLTTARRGRQLVLKARSPLRGRRAELTFVTGTCARPPRCSVHKTRRTVRLGARTVTRLPVRPRGRGGYVQVRVHVPAFSARGLRWPSLHRQL